MPSRSRLYVHMAKNHATIAARMDAMRRDVGVDWDALLREWRAANIVPAGLSRNAAQQTWARVNRYQAWKRYEKAGSGVHVVEHAPVPLNPPATPQAPTDDEPGEDALTRMLIQRRGEY